MISNAQALRQTDALAIDMFSSSTTWDRSTTHPKFMPDFILLKEGICVMLQEIKEYFPCTLPVYHTANGCTKPC